MIPVPSSRCRSLSETRFGDDECANHEERCESWTTLGDKCDVGVVDWGSANEEEEEEVDDDGDEDEEEVDDEEEEEAEADVFEAGEDDEGD